MLFYLLQSSRLFVVKGSLVDHHHHPHNAQVQEPQCLAAGKQLNAAAA
jgi:hypothetical protein